jgi:hypothetical protein
MVMIGIAFFLRALREFGENGKLATRWMSLASPRKGDGYFSLHLVYL